MSISFNQIPINLLTPGAYVEFDNSRALTGLVNQTQRILLIAPKLAAGTGIADKPVQLSNSNDGLVAFGRGSIGAAMVTALFNQSDTVETWILPIADGGGGTAATASVVIGGTPTEAGTLAFYIAGRRLQIGITTTDTASTIAAALNAAINADADMVITSTVSTATLTLTARNNGILGNDIDLRINYYPLSERTPAGVTVTITAFASGAGDSSIATALSNIGDTQYTAILMAFIDDTNVGLIETLLDDRWGPLKQNDGHCFIGKRGTVGTLNTWASTRNSPHLSAVALENNGSPNPMWEVAAAIGTQAAYYLGIDPARPLQTIKLTGILPPPRDKQFTRAERNNVLSYGLATVIVDAGGNTVIERCVTTYTQNTAGITDPSYRDVETMFTLSYLRFSTRARVTQKFPRFKLRGDAEPIPPGQAMINPRGIRIEMIALCKDWIDAGLVEDLEQFKSDLIVEIDNNDKNRVNVLLPPNLVNQFRIYAAKMQFII